jgi:hypothetical protein
MGSRPPLLTMDAAQCSVCEQAGGSGWLVAGSWGRGAPSRLRPARASSSRGSRGRAVVVPASVACWGEGGGRLLPHLLPHLLLFLRRLCSSRYGRGRGRASASSPRGRTEGAAPRLAAPPAGSG